MSLLDALKMLVLGTLLLFLATKCAGKDHLRTERLKATSADTTPNSP